MSVLGIFSYSYPMGRDRNHLSEQRWGFGDFGLFFSNFGPNLTNFSPTEFLNTLEQVYYRSPMSVLGIFSHSYPMGRDRNHLSEQRWGFGDFGIFSAILAQI